MMNNFKERLAVIGAGPIGLEIALYGLACGFDVHVYESGSVCENLRRWGHVVLFSPWSMNHSPLGEEFLRRERPDLTLPEEGEYLSGHKLFECYFKPLAELTALKNRIHDHQKVIAVGRVQIRKKDLIGSQERSRFPFRLLLKDAEGSESVVEADVVMDASGVYSNPRPFGEGGIPALDRKSTRLNSSHRL